jgi:hypothetical protein
VAIFAAVLSLRDATENGFKRLEAKMVQGFAGVAQRLGRLAVRLDRLERRVDAMATRFDRFEVKVLERFDLLDARLTAVEQG